MFYISICFYILLFLWLPASHIIITKYYTIISSTKTERTVLRL